VSVLLAGLLTSFAYIVDHAMSLDAVSESRAASLLSVLGLSSVVTLLLVGWVSDQPSTDATVLYTGALLVAGASTVALPSLRSYPLLVGYQVVYGACCGTIVTTTHERDTVSSWSWLSLVYCTEPTTKKWKNRRKSKKNGCAQKYRRIRGVSPEEEKECCDGNDLQKRRLQVWNERVRADGILIIKSISVSSITTV